MAEQNQGHRQRLKERFLNDGFDHFEPHTMLELLLFYAIPRRDTNKIAHDLMSAFGSLSGVLDASVEDLARVDGMGPHAATLIKVTAAFARPYMEDRYDGGDILNSTDSAIAYLMPKYIGRRLETAYLICLDSRKKIIYSDVLAEGTLDSIPIFIRKIVEIALRVGARYVILAHNHPSGFALPSADDMHTTKKIQQTLETISVRLLDHVIIAGNDAVSMAESGFLHQ